MKPMIQSDFVSKEGRFKIDAKDKPTTGGMPSLTVKNLVQGNIIKVTCNFYVDIEVRKPLNKNGFYFEIKAKPDADTKVQAVTPAKSVVYNFTPKFDDDHAVLTKMNCSLTVFFEVIKTNPPSDIDFEIEFSAGESAPTDASSVQGRATLNNFLLMAAINA